MSDRELRDELITLLTAGHETSATALAWAFERLLRNPAAMRERLQSVDRDGDEYADAVVKETLRVRPVIIDVARLVTSDVELGGWTIPRGHDRRAGDRARAVDAARCIPDPHEFRPERFLDGQPAPYTWIPFGGGVRRCLGAAFAQLEIRTVLRTVLARAQLQAPDPAPGAPAQPQRDPVPDAGRVVVMDERGCVPAAPPTYA